MEDGFSVKSVVTRIENKIDRFIERDIDDKKAMDKRVDILEQHKASIVSNFTVLAWVFGALISVIGIFTAIIQIK